MLLVWRTTFEAPTGDSADRVIYSWGLDGPLPNTAAMQSLRAAVEGAWVAPPVAPATTNMKQTVVAGYRMIFHEVFHATGGPAVAVIDAENAPDTVTTGAVGPTEVQLVVSRLITTPRGLQPVGRIYYGPIGGANGLRPSITQQRGVLNHALQLHQNFVVAGYDPRIIAKQGTALAGGKSISGYKCDQLWDTQRRRGISQAPPGSTMFATPGQPLS